MSFADESCVACRPDSPPVTGGERETLLKLLDGWRVVEVDGVPQLEKRYVFEDFAAALAFTNAVGAVAEAEDHHPALLTEWGAVTVTWWTHTIRNVHRNDFILAARCDAIAGVS